MIWLIEIIKPVLRRLGPLHNFSVETQVQLQAPLAFPVSELEEGEGTMLSREQLSVFVNSAEWTLCELFPLP